MKFLVIFIIFVIGISTIPNYVEAQTNESVCKSLHRSYVQGVYQLDQEKYEKCVANYEKQDFWRDMRPWGLGIFFLALFAFIGIVGIKSRTKTTTTFVDYSFTPSPIIRKGWTVDEKEQVRIRQDGKCAHCNKPPPRWEYHHINGDRSNNSLDNCEGLCPNCHSVETHEG